MSRPQDLTAQKIGTAYRRGLVAYVECGRLLLAAKASMTHGTLGEWLKANRETLTFGERTAQKLMRAAKANPTLTADMVIPNDQLRALNRTLWGNSEREPTKDSEDDDSLESHQQYSCFTRAPTIALAREVLGGIDTDPMSCEAANKTVGATTFYDRKVDGLTKPWRGRVWLNSPFQTHLITPATEKLLAEIDCGKVSEALQVGPCTLDRPYWHGLIFKRAALICIGRGRERFDLPDGTDMSPRNGVVFAYYGSDLEKFDRVFSTKGAVMAPRR